MSQCVDILSTLNPLPSRTSGAVSDAGGVAAVGEGGVGRSGGGGGAKSSVNAGDSAGGGNAGKEDADKASGDTRKHDAEINTQREKGSVRIEMEEMEASMDLTKPSEIMSSQLVFGKGIANKNTSSVCVCERHCFYFMLGIQRVHVCVRFECVCMYLTLPSSPIVQRQFVFRNGYHTHTHTHALVSQLQPAIQRDSPQRSIVFRIIMTVAFTITLREIA